MPQSEVSTFQWSIFESKIVVSSLLEYFVFSYKKDGQLNATNNGVNLFSTVLVPETVKNALKDVNKVMLKAGAWGDEVTKVDVKTDNQENVKAMEDTTVDNKTSE